MLVGHPREIGERQPLLDHEARGQIERARARHRDVVDRAVDRERADVAAGKEDRRDDIGVGRHHHPPGRDVEGRLVVAGAEPGVVEGGEEDVLDQLPHRAPAGAVRQVDPAVPEVELAPDRIFAGSRDLLPPLDSRFLAKAAVGPVRRAGALGRDHAGAHRRVRRADRPEQPAFARRLDAAQDRAALAGRIVPGRLSRRGRSAAPRRKPANPGRRRSALAGRKPRPRHSNASRVSNTAATSACALTLPDRVTARIYWFSTSARPSLIWRTSIRIACATSSGSKPAITTGLP